MLQPLIAENPPIQSPAAERGRLAGLFALEILGSIGGTLMMLGIFFYMQTAFQWGARRNLELSAAQGAIYVVGALSASAVADRLGKRPMLRLLNAIMGALAVVAFCYPTEKIVVTVLLIYTICVACQWPIIESLVSSGTEPEELSRRISVYNLFWSATGALAMAACGVIIAHFSRGIFLAALAGHVTSSIVLLFPANDPIAPHGHADPDPQLLPLRTMAMHLSRIALPATYAVIYALGALMPTLPVLAPFSPTMKTLIASVWMAARSAAFLLLGATIWWQTRPRALLIAAIVLLISFLGITVFPSIIGMILWQIALGLAIGFIYAASLYFGMVLSAGNAEQGGYHEALIGLGSILGPGSGALAEAIRPGSQMADIAAVAAVLWISAMLAVLVSARSGRDSS
ncbi:MAG: MFS transporter [Tepidisphaeraceae bacterium]|jgi:MFS family permease